MNARVFVLIALATIASTTDGVGQSASTYSRQHGYRATSTGWLLSIAGTAIPIVIASEMEDADGLWLGLLGIAVGPSMGNLYAGDAWRGFTGIGLRTVGLSAVLAGIFVAWDANEKYANSAKLAFFGGSVTVVASALFNLGTIGKSVKDFNKRLDGVAITPYLDPVNKAGGFQFSLRI